MKQRPWKKLDERALLLWRAEGVPIHVCAARLSRTVGAVQVRLSKLRATRPRRAARELMRAVRRLWLPGRSDEEIAERLSVTKSAVQQARVRAGLPPGVPYTMSGRAAGVASGASRRQT